MLTRLIVVRTAQALATLLAVSALIFFAAEVLPGDIAARVLGREATDAEKAVFRDRLHLDRPAVERYGIWLKNVAQGDLGRSLISDEKVSEIISDRLANTLWLGFYAFALYVPLTVVVATAGAAFRDRTVDRSTSLLTLIGLSLPEFVVATLLVLIFAITVPLFPALSYAESGASVLDHVRSLTLPAITLAVAASVYAIRMLRDSLIEVLDSDYIRMATLKGVPRRRVILRHALPNALGPALNVTALNVTFLVSGVVVVELVFAYDGLGKLLVDRLVLRDTPTTEAVALIGAAAYIFANLLADVAVLLLNPRLRRT